MNIGAPNQILMSSATQKGRRGIAQQCHILIADPKSGQKIGQKPVDIIKDPFPGERSDDRRERPGNDEERTEQSRPAGTRSNASARTIPTASWPMIDAAVHLIDTPKAFQKLEDPRRSV